MKTFALTALGMALALMPSSAPAQGVPAGTNATTPRVTGSATNSATQAKIAADLKQAQAYFDFQSQTMNRVLGVTRAGLLPKLKDTPNPWQLFNPLAPPEYGSGFDNVSYDPHTGLPDGILLWAVKF